MANYLFCGTIIHWFDNQLQIIQDGYIYVTRNKIVSIGQQKPEVGPNTIVTVLSNSQFLCPGFIDTHIHAPQYPNAGLGYDVELLDWLQKYTFPQEGKFRNVEYGEQIYRQVIKRTITSGTTTASYFATSHLESSLKLADLAIELGQRAFIGLINMVDGPEELICNNSESIDRTSRFIKEILQKGSDLVKPIITPRFALSCNMELLIELGKLAKKHDLNIQTHISENKFEIIETLKKYPNCKSYAEIYDKAGLLTKKTVLAHAVHLTDDEKSLLCQRGASISHCPNSNTCLHSGLCDVRSISENGITCSLGTDIAGGANPTILDAMRSCLQTANHIDYTHEGRKALNYADAFYMATLGGAKALDLDNRIGNFEVGKEFDALVVDVGNVGAIDILEENYSPLDLLQKFIYLGDDRNIVHVFVASKRIK